VNCVVSSWSTWQACSATCGYGSHSRSRTIDVNAANGGSACPTALAETKDCATFSCPIDCKGADWGGWSACSRACGDGTQERTRNILVSANYGGVECAGGSTAERSCNKGPCKMDCQVSGFGNWSVCPVTCGGGAQYRNQTTISNAVNGGKACPPLNEERLCMTQDCPINCEMSEWGGWGDCSASCGSGTQEARRTINTNHAHGGAPCPLRAKTQKCNIANCPVNCEMSAWPGWDPCPVSCGEGGAQYRWRNRRVSPTYGGKACGLTYETRNCNDAECPVDCQVGDWGGWQQSQFGACSLSCGGGVRTRERFMEREPQHGGRACPTLNDSGTCNADACAVDCVVDSTWSAWSSCTKSCGTGSQSHSRAHTPPTDGGKACPHFMETRECNTHACAVACDYAHWTVFGACSTSCGGGTKSRTRAVTDPSNGGTACPHSAETAACDHGPCPVHCATSAFSAWSTCSKSCGTGQQSRSRSVVVSDEHEGYACPYLEETRDCNTNACATDCIIDMTWSAWSACTKSCGQGSQSRSRAHRTRVRSTAIKPHIRRGACARGRAAGGARAAREVSLSRASAAQLALTAPRRGPATLRPARLIVSRHSSRHGTARLAALRVAKASASVHAASCSRPAMVAKLAVR
jgi:hypothetical protein